jgi:hypothetical protein
MNSFSFGKEIYGIRWGKYCDGVLHILYEQNNLFDLISLKKKIENEIENRIHYFVLKEYQINIQGYNDVRYEWVECEKEVIFHLP